MEDQNNDEATKLLKVLGKALGSFELLVEFFEGINGKKMSPKQKQILSKVTGLTPTIADLSTNAHCDDTDVGQGRGVAYLREQATVPGETIASNPYVNEETEWLFNFDYINEVGDISLTVTDKSTKEWVGIKWTPEGVEVYNKTSSYMERYHSGYRVNSPGIMAHVTLSFNESTVPFRAQTGLCLIEHDGQYHLLGTVKIDGVTIETPLIHTHLGMINRSAVLTNLLNRLEVQKQRQSTQPRKEATAMECKNKQEKVKLVLIVKVNMTGDVTAHGGLVVTITSNMNNKTNIIKWFGDYVQIIDPSFDHRASTVPHYPVIVNKPNGINSHNQELKCVCAHFMLPIHHNSLTEVKAYLAMTGEKFFRKLVGFITIGDETILMPEVPLTPRMIAEIEILQTLLTTLTDQPELELPDKEIKTPCFKSLTPNPIPQPIFNPYGSHPSFGPTPYPPQ